MKNKQILLFMVLLFLTAKGFAFVSQYPHGAYGAISFGRGYNHLSKNNFDSNLNGEDNSVWAGRIALGFDIDRYFGIEAGYQLFQQRKFNNLNNGGSGTVDEYAIDLQTVLKWPLFKGVNLFAKIGPAYVNAKQNADAGAGTSRHIKTWRPRYALGIAANLPSFPGVSLIATYSRIVKDSDKHLPNADLYALGLIFHF